MYVLIIAHPMNGCQGCKASKEERRTISKIHAKRRIVGVGTLQDGSIPNVPLPRVVPRVQSARPSAIALPPGIPIPGYLQVPIWIPMLPRIGSILGFSQRIL